MLVKFRRLMKLLDLDNNGSTVVQEDKFLALAAIPLAVLVTLVNNQPIIVNTFFGEVLKVALKIRWQRGGTTTVGPCWLKFACCGKAN